MPTLSPTTFWASLGIVATAIGGLFTMQTSHANDNGHESLAGREDLSRAEIKLERVATEVNHHTRLLDDMRVEIKEISRRQADSSQEILEAIRGR
ncbi:MAG: hypothetical protein CME21_21355 [Gemmatimonadetes bacterium]|nr:hypothetical protein [Gemmatimonadota bacterium]